MSAPYTEKDLLQIVKAVSAAGQAVLDAHQAFAVALGAYAAIKAELDNAPPGMTPLALKLNALISGPTDAYNAIVDVLQSGI